MRESKTSARRLKAAERVNRYLELRREGKTYKQIGELCGVAFQSVQRTVSLHVQGLACDSQELASQLRDLELCRLDAAYEAIKEKVAKGDLPAINTLIRLSERRAKLLGLDAPSQVRIGDLDLDDAINRELELAKLATGGEVQALPGAAQAESSEPAQVPVGVDASLVPAQADTTAG